MGGVAKADMAQRLFESIGHEMENIDLGTDQADVEAVETEKPTGAKQIGEKCTMPGCKDSFGHPGIMRGGKQTGSIQCSGKRKHTWFFDEGE